jgi:hypothetical protein
VGCRPVFFGSRQHLLGLAEIGQSDPNPWGGMPYVDF